MTRAIAPLMLIAALAGCGTPQEQCIRTNTRELRTLDRLIAETEGNIARGYAYREIEIVRSVWVPCGHYPAPPPPPGGGTPPPPPSPRMCLEDETDVIRKPVAIDLDAERAKLASMERKRAELAERAIAVVAACKQQYPE